MHEEVKKVNKLDGSTNETKTATAAAPSGVVIMTGVAKKTTEQKRKGELIEQNQDGLEVNFHTILNIYVFELNMINMMLHLML